MFIWMPPTEAPDSRPAPGKESEKPSSAPDFFSVPLRAIRDFAGMPLRWVKTNVGRFSRHECELQLRCGEEILALVRYDPLYDLPQALARTKQGTWSFRGRCIEVAIETDKGDRTLVRPYGQRRFLTHLTPYHNPTLSLPNGHDYFLKTWGLFLRTHHRWLAADTALVTFRVTPMWGSIAGEVEVHPPAAALSELDLLITLGWYLALTRPGGSGP